MKIRIGRRFGETEQIIDVASLAILSPEDVNRTMFAIVENRKNPTEIEISTYGVFGYKGQSYSHFTVRPIAANVVAIGAIKC